MAVKKMSESTEAKGRGRGAAVSEALAMAVKKMSKRNEAKGCGRGADVSGALAMAVKKIFSGYKLSLP
ncbi:MAG: hypothetical protein MR947_09080 [Mitsuokella jalaludinii]|uniref:hypothetical protein n=1 Tax=Mitsuokella jalaludinii TaxID=187979 RepID=UPI0024316F72|nr:hypothetical protein [Mitsuokella jalaludinii]MCI7064729.1 hypothetical protein [Mitsuokella jalaludinii]MCI7185855.1 hypothetical protein [Mitsuokella jalaludinii]MCI7716794.1 hypothetical protein [Mitsuokella jalaludinii]MDD7745360.1 hypothetical protein [Mitsuokella jalaludinii]MDY5364233.1 hypothetical protein [Mitsuokella jalaludinii]